MSPEWAAGFFSGEGCTYVRKTDVNPRRRFEYRYIAMAVGQKNRRTLEQFQEAIGGHGTIRHNNGRPNCPWSWECQGGKAEAAMAVMFPYLSREKRWQYLRVRRKCRVFRKGRQHRTYVNTSPSMRGLVAETSV